MTDKESVSLALAKVSGELKSFRELFHQHTTNDMEQFTELKTSIKEINTKVDKLLLREATRSGESTGVKRSAIVLSTIIAIFISSIGLAVNFLV